MKTEKFVIAFPDSRNNTMYVDGSNKGNNSKDLAIEFNSIEDAIKYKNEKAITSEAWIEDSEDEIVHSFKNE